MPRVIWIVLLLFCLVFSSSFQLLTLLTNGATSDAWLQTHRGIKYTEATHSHSPLLELPFAVSPVALVLSFLISLETPTCPPVLGLISDFSLIL